MSVPATLPEIEEKRRSSWLRLRRLCGFPVLLAVLLAGFVFLVLPKSNADPDLGWHLRNAQYQLQHHKFLRQDVYSFTVRGKPWMDDEWLGELPFYMAWRLLGPQGIFLLTYLLIAGILLSIFALAIMRSGNVKASFLCSFAAVFLASVSFGPRTLLFGWALLVIELVILYRFRRGGGSLWALPPLFLLWVNMHGSWIIGFVLLAIFALSGCLGRSSGVNSGSWGGIDLRRWTTPERKKLAWVVALSALALFINPYGWQLVEYPFNMAFQQKLNIASVMEWRSLNFHLLRGRVALLLLLAGIVIELKRPRRWRVEELAFLLIGIYAGFTYERFIFLTAILAIPFLAEDLRAWVGPYDAAHDKPWLNACIILGCLIAIVLRFPSDRRLERAWSTNYPLQAQSYLAHFHPAGNVLNDYLWGGYLIWHDRQVLVFIDSRVDVFERNGVLKSYLDARRMHGSLQILDKYSIRYVLFQRHAALSYLLEHTPGWKIDYQDPTTILFERTGALHARGSTIGP